MAVKAYQDSTVTFLDLLSVETPARVVVAQSSSLPQNDEHEELPREFCDAIDKISSGFCA